MAKIIDVLCEILTFKSSTTISELSSYSKKSKLETLQIINQNKDLLRLDKKGHIFGFVDVRGIYLNKARKEGLTYRTEIINYGAATELSCLNPKIDQYKQTYWCGGLGDCYSVQVILDSEENRKLIENLGIVDAVNFVTPTIEELWKE